MIWRCTEIRDLKWGKVFSLSGTEVGSLPIKGTGLAGKHKFLPSDLNTTQEDTHWDPCLDTNTWKGKDDGLKEGRECYTAQNRLALKICLQITGWHGLILTNQALPSSRAARCTLSPRSLALYLLQLGQTDRTVSVLERQSLTAGIFSWQIHFLEITTSSPSTFSARSTAMHKVAS